MKLRPDDLLAGAQKMSVELELVLWKHRKDMLRWVRRALRDYRPPEIFPVTIVDLSHSLNAHHLALGAAAAGIRPDAEHACEAGFRG